MLLTFKLLKKYRNLNKFTIEFNNGLNVIVGENGSGKSSFLNLIMDHNKEIVEITTKDNAKYRFFDSEKNNPRLNNAVSTNLEMFNLHSHFISHGEAMLPIIKAMSDFKNETIIIDEPESGLSLSNQKIVIDLLNDSIKNNCQIIISTHSYVIIKNTKHVFSMNKLKWISSKEFLKKI